MLFIDHVLHDSQLLAKAAHDETHLQIMQNFNVEVVRSGGVCEKRMMMNLFGREQNMEPYLNRTSNLNSRVI